MQTSIDSQELKGLIKQALVEVIEERPNLLREAFEEVLEDIALGRAMEEGRQSGIASREEVFAVFEERG